MKATARVVISAMDARLEDGEERCLMVGEGLYSCEEYVRLAMKKGFNVLKAAPGGRDFEESAELVRLADDEGIKFGIANPRRYSKSFAALHDYIKDAMVDEIFLVAGFFCYAGVERAGWQKDPKLAGGGVQVVGNRIEGTIGIDATLPFAIKEKFQRTRYPVDRVDLEKWFTKKQIDEIRATQTGSVKLWAKRGG